MLSRVAERIYWGGRYLERAENTARMVSTYAGVLLDLPEESGLTWRHLVTTADAEAAFMERYRSVNERSVLTFLTTDRKNPGSIVSSVAFARENFRTTRDVLPREAWESINSLYLFSVDRMSRAIARQQLYTVLTRCVHSCQQVTGALSETLSHGDAYRFLNLGRSLERADMNTRAIDAAAAGFVNDSDTLGIHTNTIWMAVLKSQSAYQMFRQFSRRRVGGPEVLSFLLKDEQFPRSLSHCLEALSLSLKSLPHHEQAQASTAKLQAMLARTTPETMTSPALREWIDEAQIGFQDIHDDIVEAWFLPAHAA